MAIEGGSESRLVQLLMQLGYNKDVDIEFGTVTQSWPHVNVRLDNVDFDLDADDLVIPDHLRTHTRTMTINGGTTTSNGTPLHSHDIEPNSVNVTINSPLIVGTRVVIVSDVDRQLYVVIGVVS